MSAIKCNTEGVVFTFGRYEGAFVRRVPFSYLRYLANQTGLTGRVDDADGRDCSWPEILQAEMHRRGERMDGVEISLHAIDNASARLHKLWIATRRNDDEGIVTWLEKRAKAVIESISSGRRDEVGRVTVYDGQIEFVFRIDTVVPTLLTVKRRKGLGVSS